MTAKYATENYTQTGLLAGDYPAVTRSLTILAGQILTAGAVLGRVTATDKYVLSDDGASDGSENPVLILPFAVDATAGDVDAVAYASGEFDAAKLNFGGTHTAATVEAAFRQAGLPLFVRTLN